MAQTLHYELQDSDGASQKADRDIRLKFAPSRMEPKKRMDEMQVTQWLAEYAALRREGTKINSRHTALLNDIKTRLSHHYRPLVESVARRFVSSGEPFEDLVQEGFLGLLSALDNFKEDKGVKFSTYATHFIAGTIRHFLRDRGKIIKEPAWLHELAGKINRTHDSLFQALGREPSPAEIAQELNLTEEAVAEVIASRQVFQVAAFAAQGDDDDGSLVGLVDPEKIRSDHYVTLQLPIEDRIALEEAASRLKALEQHVLYEFFYKDLNQTEVAKKLGISCNYVSHILKNSTKKIRKMLGDAEVRDRARHQESSILVPASGLFTQDHALARITEELTRAARTRANAGLIFLTVDGLPQNGVKREEAWMLCGETVRGVIRRMDVSGHYEQDSLLIFLPQTDTEGTMTVAERLADRLVVAGAANRFPISVRFGVAMYPAEARFLRDLLARAQEGTITPLVLSEDESEQTPKLRIAA
ncbi:MAG: hypothetical protein OHK0029_11960 [Armatimonadaceae bacterium]